MSVLPLFHFFKRHKFIALGLVALVIVIFIFFRPKPPEKLATERATLKDITKTVSANGKISASQEVTFAIPLNTKITYIGVKNGDSVKKGQILITFDQRTLQKNLETSLRDYAKQRNTFESTLDSNNVSKPQDAATESVRRILENNQFDLEKAVLSVELLSLAKEQSVISSPIDGIVTNSTIDVAGITSTASDSLTVVNPNGLEFLIDIDEADVGLIEKNQEVEITLDAFPDQIIKGTISTVDFASHPTSTGGTAFSTKVLLPPKADVYRIGMNGDADIVVAEEKQILSIPSSSLFEDEFVYVKKSEVFEKRKIKIGLQNDFDIEVISGLKVGEEVALDPEKVTLRQAKPSNKSM
ncbi:MAG: efflux RND transporter periplasmic adaptor subunit [Candidatus Levybacteria bacterium]|nr:efflux RND transporter periplasmic adaptor subunit [Candidatus Levybacteria bacterium]